VKPATEAWTGVEVMRRTVPRLPKISTKQLIGVVHTSGQLPIKSTGLPSERGARQQPVDMQIIKNYGKAKAKGDGFCYYYNNKKPMNRNV
jgi:hypothetical protein